MKTTVIYSKENATSVSKVAKFRKRHSHYLFVEVSDADGVKSAREGIKHGGKVIELDAPVKKKVATKKPTTKKVEKKKTKVSAVKPKVNKKKATKKK